LKLADGEIQMSSDMSRNLSSIEQFEGGFHVGQRLAKHVVADWESFRRHSFSGLIDLSRLLAGKCF